MLPHERLENEIGEWLQNDNVVVCSSGTAALHLALETLRLPLGSRIGVCDYNMVAVPRSCVLAGHVPFFHDCNENLLACKQTVRKSITDLASAVSSPAFLPTDSIQAIIVTHLYGRRVDIPSIRSAVGDIPIIEDLSQLHGVPPHCLSYAGVMSFYKNKVVHGEEGGCVLFGPNRQHAQYARSLRSLGFTLEHDFYHQPRGHNYRLADTLAELIRDSLQDYPVNLERRRWQEQEITRCTQTHLAHFLQQGLPPREIPWVYDLVIPGMTRYQQQHILDHLRQIGLNPRHGFRPMTDQLEFSKRSPIQPSQMKLSHPNAYRLGSEVLYLPLGETACTDWQKLEGAFETMAQILDRKFP